MLEAFISPNPQALDAVDQDEDIDSVVRRFFKGACPVPVTLEALSEGRSCR